MQSYRSAKSHPRPAKQSKIASQRQYRVKEGDGFQELRDIIHLLTGITPQSRYDTLTKAVELLKQVSKPSSRDGSLPALESPQTSLCDFNQSSQEYYEPLTLPNNDAWTRTNAKATWTMNSSSMPNSSAMSLLPERHSYPQAETDHIVEAGGRWNFIPPTPPQFRQYSSQSQWNDLSLIHSNIDEVPFYVDRVGVN